MIRVAALGCLILSGCGVTPDPPHWTPVGDAKHGQILAERMGCGSCHVIPGLQTADGMVGPPLTHFARRTIIAGVLPNTPPNLIRWIQTPQAVVPGNAMPDAQLTTTQASDIAAYLYTLD